MMFSQEDYTEEMKLESKSGTKNESFDLNRVKVTSSENISYVYCLSCLHINSFLVCESI